MRLAAVKIRGFKSFADTVSFKADGTLIGVIGPNGCGKSNIVDAIRWGLGESKASSLRGSSLPDVLFGGSAKRESADWCNVELHFDNSDSSAPTMWNAYSQIVVKRELARDGRQGYQINGNPMRRRDVVDLFRGTGVAPRAYGVIEQGMITHIADSSPDELRSFMEEAAGVSHYKERRKESERRLQASRDNLEQLVLVLDGLAKRAASLKRQAEKARKYKLLSDEINTLDALIIAAERGEAKAKLAEQQKKIGLLTDQVSVYQKKLQDVKAAEIANKSGWAKAQTDADEKQQLLSAAQTALVSVERDLQNASAGKETTRKKLSHGHNALEDLVGQINEKETAIAALSKQVVSIESNISDGTAAVDHYASELTKLQQDKSEKQEKLELAREKLSLAKQQLEAQALRQQMLEENLQALDKRINDANAALVEIAESAFTPSDLSDSEAAVAEKEKLLNAKKAEQDSLLTELASEEKTVRGLENDMAAVTTEINTLQMMLVGEGGDDQSEEEKTNAKRLAHLLQVEAKGWARALDAALGEYAGAVAVEDLAAFYAQNSAPAVGTAVVELQPVTDAPTVRLKDVPSLLSMLDLPPANRSILAGWLSGVYVADSDEEALFLRQRLQFGESVVTRDGKIFTARSLFVHGETRGGYNWEQRMRDLSKAQDDKQQELTAAGGRLLNIQKQISVANAQANEMLANFEAARQNLAEQQIEQSRLQERHYSNERRRQEIEKSIQTMRGEQEAVTRSQLEHVQTLQKLANTQSDMQENFAKAQAAVETADGALEAQRKRIDDGEKQKRIWEQECADIAQQRAANSARLEDMRRRKNDLETNIHTWEAELSVAGERDLQNQVTARQQEVQVAETALADCRRQLQDYESKRTKLEEQAELLRTDAEKIQAEIADKRLMERELTITIDHCTDSLEEFSLSEDTLADMQNSRRGEVVGDWKAEIDNKRDKRERLGAINFAADSELRECEDRITESTAQKNDVETAVNELKATIQRIDSETKQRLQSMFDGVNREFSQMFIKLFGGGSAQLEMVGDTQSILESGFELRACPPGKRVFSVRMLSGGEKAAAAVAFIFAILRLNPPPFCILDEVDATLDDNRAARFANLLSEIAEDVQCLVITHNKGTIATIPKLVGVTQEEQGVSKIVTTTLDSTLRAPL